MNRYFIPILLLFSINCAAQQNKSNWTKPELEGQWEFVTATTVEDTPFLSYYPNPHTAAVEALPPEPGPNLIFEKDTMYVLDWPMLLINRTRFTLDSGYLHNYTKWLTESRPIELVNDTLYIYRLLYGKSYIKEGYVKTSLDDSIVDILKRDEVNYPELAGNWFLVREEILSGEDGSEWEYLLEFPHNIPDSIEISREQFINGLKQNMVYLMSTDEKKQEYFFKIHWDILYLTPGEWYKGEDPGIHFEKRKNEH